MKKTLIRVLKSVGLSVVMVSYGVLVEARVLHVPLEYSTIQSAINAAVDGDTVLVDDGTYIENINFLGKGITVESVNGTTSTIIDGNDSGSVVTFNSGEGTKSVLSGFTIQNGSATFGGGIYCKAYSSPTITNCTISGNSAICGGGICCKAYSSPTITNCTISGNSANESGGGISCLSSSPMIINCTIRRNSARDGGGILCSDYSSPTITNCTISGNLAAVGGGIYCFYYSSPTITNCTINGNVASLVGGIACFYSSPTITNCTISNNSDPFCGGIYCYSSSPRVVNSILWDDNPKEIHLEMGSSIDITYSDIEGGWAGEGNIDADPLFVGSGDYHLTADSPCIDTGTSTGAPPDDIDGDTRPQGAGYDMGSDEYVEEIQLPVPDVKANGSDGTITTSGPVSITIELNSGGYAGQNADWWHVAETPFGWYRYQVSGNTWVPGLTVSYQGPLFDLTPPFNTLNTSLPSGTYTIYFGVDMNMNGVIDFDSLYYDRVVVIVP
ncbi:MAG: right-handed parallel beta-helix repeat-containing protein [bacterium]